MVARLTPDQKVACSNLVVVTTFSLFFLPTYLVYIFFTPELLPYKHLNIFFPFLCSAAQILFHSNVLALQGVVSMAIVDIRYYSSIVVHSRTCLSLPASCALVASIETMHHPVPACLVTQCSTHLHTEWLNTD